jgi:hypothetical protein
MDASIQASIPLNDGGNMAPGERRYNDHDLQIASKLGGVETLLKEHIMPTLERIENNCRQNICRVPAQPAPSSSAWFWGKVAGLATAVLAGATAVCVAVVQIVPQVIAFFAPPKP